MEEKGHRTDRGLFTAGENGRGRGGWEDSDQLHADLQRRPRIKRLPGERERERETQTERNRKSERQSDTFERNGERTMAEK